MRNLTLGRRMASVLVPVVVLLATLAPAVAHATITINTSTASDWKISNGVITIDFNSTTGHIFGIHLAGHSDNLIDVNTTQSGQPKGLYMDNAGTIATSTTTAGFTQNGNTYLDWWMTTASSSSNAFTYTQHFIITDNDPGLSVYLVANHSASDIAGNLAQAQWVFRLNTSLFTTTYSVDSALNDRGATKIPLPGPGTTFNTDPGRAVQDATVDLHGLSTPTGFDRYFYTKYDYSSYEYL